jgi:hypothetical protein
MPEAAQSSSKKLLGNEWIKNEGHCASWGTMNWMGKKVNLVAFTRAEAPTILKSVHIDIRVK